MGDEIRLVLPQYSGGIRVEIHVIRIKFRSCSTADDPEFAPAGYHSLKIESVVRPRIFILHHLRSDHVAVRIFKIGHNVRIVRSQIPEPFEILVSYHHVQTSVGLDVDDDIVDMPGLQNRSILDLCRGTVRIFNDI